MKVIGLTGPICSGTDSVARILVKRDFKWFSFSDLILKEAKRREIEITRKGLQDLGDELRKEKGLGVLSEMIIEKISNEENCVVGDMRNPGEVEVFKEKFGEDFVLILIEAPLKIRFKRILKRHRKSDPETMENFQKLEKRDLGLNEANYGQQHAKVFKMANFTLINDSGLEELNRKVDKLLKELN